MDDTEEQLAEEMKTKRICRFCLTQEEPMSDIFSTEAAANNYNWRTKPTPLTLQIMACVSIEVYKDDGMPSTICNNCRLLMDHSYHFKQICKKADTLLKTYPLTGVWPEKLAVSINLFKSSQPLTTNEDTQPRKINQLKRRHSTYQPPIQESKPITVAQVKPSMKRQPKEEYLENEQETVEEVEVKPKIVKLSIEDLRNIKQGKPIEKTRNLYQKAGPTPKKSPVKVINGNLGAAAKKPILLNTMLSSKKTEEHVVQVADGRLEIVSMEASETDPVKVAEPVATHVFPCNECDRSFPLRQLLEIHKSNHNRERNHPCELCDKRFFSKYDLAKHNMTHTGERPFVCVICKSAFPRATLLTRHQKIHKDQPKFVCMYCQRSFFSDEELQKHTETHQKRRPFHCKKCPKSFAYKQGLERHEITHDSNLPYPCEHCDVSFPTAAKLARHLTAHAGGRPYPCRMCSKSYMLSHHLTRHVRTHQAGKGVYKCSDCLKNFNSVDDLVYHSAVHATTSLNCPLCQEHFETVDLVTAHIKLHSEGEQHACDYCDLLFLDAKRLEEHCQMNHLSVLATDRLENDSDLNASSTDDAALETPEQLIIEKIVIGRDGSKTITTFVDGEQKDEKVVLKPGKTSRTAKAGESYSGKQATNEHTVKHEIFFDSEDLPVAEEEYVELTDNEVQLEPQEIYYEEHVLPEIKPEHSIQTQIKSNATESRSKPQAATSERKNVSPTKNTPLKTVPETNFIKPSVQKKMDSFFKKAPSKSPPEKTDRKSIGDVLKNLPKGMTVKRPTQTIEQKEPVKPVISRASATPLRTFASKKKTESKVAPVVELAPAKRSSVRQQNEKQSPDTGNVKTGVKRPLENERSPPSAKRMAFETPVKSIASATKPSNVHSIAKPSPGLSSASKRSKTFEMKIGDKMVKVQKVIMTKSEVAAMARDGKIEMQGETMILKK
ncbi:RE1-silencing transcription factor-like [Wyeomyia smithii]|uniref:RE1-silencing transcription factor-like n=1 Tax=Wyeomyia smithii TaxID=174621 RepID=UPI002467FC88|nr:RE1-silencing transcription factor-like [Wyeomyia smithii]